MVVMSIGPNFSGFGPVCIGVSGYSIWAGRVETIGHDLTVSCFSVFLGRIGSCIIGPGYRVFGLFGSRQLG